VSEERGRSEVAPPSAAAAAYDEVEDATVIVERTAERPAGASLAPDPDWDPAEADTADRPEEATVIVDRTGGAGEVDETRVVDRGASAERADRAAEPEPVASPAEPVMHAPARRRRREPAPAPVPDEVLRTAEQGPGVGVLDRYPARTGEPLRMPIPELGEGPGPTRDAAAPLPSVARRSRRSAVGALVAVGVAGVLGVAGLIAVASILWRAIFG
jgi:hypothetical protein